MPDIPDDDRWRIDKKIPLPLLCFLAAQMGLGIWWAASIDARVGQMEHQVNQNAPQGERIIRLETKLDAISDRVTEIKGTLTGALSATTQKEAPPVRR